MKDLTKIRKDPNTYYVADFETTVYEGQTRTDVWAAAIVELFTDEVFVFNNAPDFFHYIETLNKNVVVYFHNLKFDGAFILQYYLGDRKFEQAFSIDEESQENTEKIPKLRMRSNSISYSISGRGMWYTITVKVGQYYIEFRDSLKLLPFSVKAIGDGFKTEHRKSSIEYTGFRKPYGEITDEEVHYIENDVLVVKEALEIMHKQHHNEVTIGSCCMDEFRTIQYLETEEEFRSVFPDLTEIKIDKEQFGSDTAEEYIRKSYRGGWCYLVPEKAGKVIKNGFTLDVNSLYPSMMHSMSGNIYPKGTPTFWTGDIPEIAQLPGKYFFVRIRTGFDIKPGRLPCIQIKGKPFFYSPVKWLTTSDIPVRDENGKLTGKYSSVYIDLDGKTKQAVVDLTLTMTDYRLILDQYDLHDFEILDGCYFDTFTIEDRIYHIYGTDIERTAKKEATFDRYIDKYKRIKMESTGAIRTISKLFLNSLYGKMATSNDSSFKVARIGEDGSLEFATVHKNEKEVYYVPIGSAITSYARNFTIRAAQKNYHGGYRDGFIYADTDSIHCSGNPNDVKGVELHDTDFCKWKLESTWDEALYVRQKTYAEHILHSCNDQTWGEWDIKCAGMPQRCKDLLEASLHEKCVEMLQDPEIRAIVLDELGPEKTEWLDTPRTIKDFKVGLRVPGKLIPKQIPGGVLLTEIPFEILESFSAFRGE